MDLLEVIKKYNSNLDTLPYGEVIEFAQKIDGEVAAELQRLETRTEEIRKQYRLFGERFTIPSKQKKSYVEAVSQDQTTQLLIGGVKIECHIIEDYKDALRHPHKICIFKSVPNWYFIAFPELGQILPVSNIENLLHYDKDLRGTKLHYGLNKADPLETMAGSDFAVVPFTKSSWEVFNKTAKKNWSKYLHQLSIRQLSVSNKSSQRIPLHSTTGLLETVAKLKPDDMATEWSLFVQLYFILFLFRNSGAGNEHFTLTL